MPPNRPQIEIALRQDRPEEVGMRVLDALADTAISPYLRFVLANIAESRRIMDVYRDAPPVVNEFTIMDLSDCARTLKATYHTGNRAAIRNAALELLARASQFLEQFDATDPEHLSTFGLTN